MGHSTTKARRAGGRAPPGPASPDRHDDLWYDCAYGQGQVHPSGHTRCGARRRGAHDPGNGRIGAADARPRAGGRGRPGGAGGGERRAGASARARHEARHARRARRDQQVQAGDRQAARCDRKAAAEAAQADRLAQGGELARLDDLPQALQLSRAVPGRRILITGIASYLGTDLARRLEADPDVEYVAGLDTRKPRSSLDKTDFIEADIRNPVIGKLIAPTEVDTIVHNQIVRQPASEGYSARKAHDVNVIGSLQLLAACEKADTVRAIVIRGSAGIYGAEPAAPQFFTEDMSRLYPLRTT